MKNFAFVLILLLTLGCDTDDTADVPQGMLAKMVVHKAGGGQYAVRYYYDGHKLDRTESNSGETEFYYYDGDLIVNIKRFAQNRLRFERQFFYDGDNRLAKTRFVSHDDNQVSTAEYAYNPDGTVTKIVYADDAMPVNPDYEILQFESGLVRRIDKYADSQIETTIYAYDDKLTPEDGIAGFAKTNMVLGDATGHNITAVDFSSTAGPATSHSIEFIYNTDGKPTFSSGDLGLVIPDSESVEYFYK